MSFELMADRAPICCAGRITARTMPMRRPLDDLPTPSLLLDQQRFERNLARMRDKLAAFGVAFRPHLKTAKSIEAARRAVERPDGPAMVSTLEEAEYFAAHGIRDLTYGVGIAPRKLE